MRPAALLLLSLGLLRPAPAEELSKPYFAATTAGAWARHEMTSPQGGGSALTYTRLPDKNGRVRFQIDYVSTSGANAGYSARSVYVMEPGFDVARHALSFYKYAESAAMSAGGSELIDTPADTVKAIRESTTDYRGAFTFEASVTVDGKPCDRFKYVARSGGAAPTVDSGTIWLDPAVPFGIVKQSGTVKQANGSVMSTYELRLAASSATSTEAAAPAVPAATPRGRATGAASIGD